jgi:hypothetical protein
VFEDRDAASAFSGFDGAHQSRGAGAKNKDIEFAIPGWGRDGRASVFLAFFRLPMVTPRSKTRPARDANAICSY